MLFVPYKTVNGKCGGGGVGCHKKQGNHCTKSVYVGEVIMQSLCVGAVIIQKKTSPDSYFQVLEFFTFLEDPLIF